MREQLEQQASQTREALFQLMQVREQLISETNARIEAQVRFYNSMFEAVHSLTEFNIFSCVINVLFDFHSFLIFVYRQERNSCCNRIENCLSIWLRWVVTRIQKMNELA